jgi:hypothetical protein
VDRPSRTARESQVVFAASPRVVATRNQRIAVAD